MADHIDDNVVFIEWVNQRERGVFDALSDTLRLKPNVPGALGRAVYHDSLVQLLGVAVVTYELYGPGHHMREYLEGYISEVKSIIDARVGNFSQMLSKRERRKAQDND
jgi:hypothetical protein